MKPHIRRRILKILAQAVPAPAATTTTPTTTAPAAQTITIDIHSIPGFRPQLFALRPDLINDINHIIGIVNRYLQTLTNNTVNFTQTWLMPAMSGSQFSNSTKNLYNLGKWLLSVIRSQAPYYTIDGLAQFANNLMTTVRRYSFPEPNAQSAQGELIAAAQRILAKLGVAAH